MNQHIIHNTRTTNHRIHITNTIITTVRLLSSHINNLHKADMPRKSMQEILIQD